MIRLRQLEAFRAVMHAASVTQAAEVLRISQPAVSRLIASLEQDLGFALFSRRRGRLLPTPESTFLLGEVERAISNLAHQVNSIGAAMAAPAPAATANIVATAVIVLRKCILNSPCRAKTARLSRDRDYPVFMVVTRNREVTA